MWIARVLGAVVGAVCRWEGARRVMLVMRGMLFIRYLDEVVASGGCWNCSVWWLATGGRML